MTDKYKIAFCTQNMAPFRMRWVNELGKYFDIDLFHLNQYDSGLNMKYINYSPENATVYCERKRFLKWWLFDFKKLFKREYDLFLLDGYGFLGQMVLILILRLRHIPFIMSIDGGFIKEKESFLSKRIKRFFISSPMAFFSTSVETDEYINYYGGNNKIKYRHYFSGIYESYIEKQPADDAEKRRLRQNYNMVDSFSIIAVGKFQHIKGFDLILEAMKFVDSKVHLYCIGASNYEQYDELILDQVRSRIHFVDFCNQETLKDYYRACDLFILPTRGDVWGLVVSEAMANGAIVVTSDKCLAGVAMLDKKDVIQAESVDAIIEKINHVTMLSENEKRQIGLRNIEKVKQYAIEAATALDIDNINDFLVRYKTEH